MNGTALAQFRLIVALLCGLACLAATAISFHMQTPLVRAEFAAFGICWFVQAYAIHNRMREVH